MKLSWRLAKLPTPDEVRELVKDKIITQEEAREILFSSETEETKDIKSLETEIKFLKDIITNLAKTRPEIVESIRYVQKPYYQEFPWYNGTVTYLCGNVTGGSNIIC